MGSRIARSNYARYSSIYFILTAIYEMKILLTVISSDEREISADSVGTLERFLTFVRNDSTITSF